MLWTDANTVTATMRYPAPPPVHPRIAREHGKAAEVQERQRKAALAKERKVQKTRVPAPAIRVAVQMNNPALMYPVAMSLAAPKMR